MARKISAMAVAATLQAGDYIPFARGGSNYKFDVSAFVLRSQVYTTNQLYNKTEIDQKFSDLVNGAPDTLNTITELANAFEQNADMVQTVNDAIGTKMSKSANGADILDPAAFRTNLQLGTASMQPATAFAPSAHTHTFTSLTGKPTTRDGYGLVDVYTKDETAALIDNATAGGLSGGGGFSGSWNDLTDKPVLFDGAWNSLTGKPVLFDGTWDSLAGKPTTLTGFGVTDVYTKTQTDAAAASAAASAVAALTAGAPAEVDTFVEAYNRFLTDESAATALNTTVAGKLDKSANLSDVADKPTARTNLGLGTAATHPATDFAPSSTVGVPTVGTNGQVLTVVSGAAAWAAPASGGAALPTQTGNSGKFLTTDGTNPAWATVSGSLPAGGAAGQVLTKNSATNGDATFQTNFGPTKPKIFSMATDFLDFGASGTITATETGKYTFAPYGCMMSGTGASITAMGQYGALASASPTNPNGGGWGYFQSSTSTGYVGLVTQANLVPFASGAQVYETRVVFQSLSDGTNTYGVALGLQAQDHVAPNVAVEGVWFSYDTGNDGTGWFLRTYSAASGAKFVSTGVTVVGQTSYKLRIEIATDGTIKGYINDVLKATVLPATHGLTSATYVSPGAGMQKTAGGSNRWFALDYIDFRAEITR